ncbi:MAG: PH domain-containing protein, partial [Acidimicrobiia bacterium]|nr:PH domain-containing protein [Acidimicrobiia bacterium]
SLGAAGAALVAVTVADAAVGDVPGWFWGAAVATVPVALALALVAYRNLGHTTTDGYLVARSGVANRATTVLQQRAVIGCTVRQSLLQRRAGLATVAVTTAAGDGVYQLSDLAAHDVAALAHHALPDVIEPLLDTCPVSSRRSRGRSEPVTARPLRRWGWRARRARRR